jgi:hypothetical protein
MGRTAPTPGCTVAPMLSGWQTLALSLGAAFLTGSFAILNVWLNIRAQRRQQLHTRQVEAASDFSRRFIGAVDAVRYAIAHPDDVGAAKNAEYLPGEVTQLLGPIAFLFGPRSEADRRARAALDDLRDASTAVKARDPDAARERLARTDASLEHFQAAVTDVVT